MSFTLQQTKRQISRFNINTTNINQFYQDILTSPLGENWPVVYLLHNDNSPVPTNGHNKLLYIGETTSAVRRMMEHFTRSNRNYPERAKLNVAHIIFDQTFNKSAILDIEQELIHMFAADSSSYYLQNKNDGQSTEHQYYERDSYINSLREIWEALRKAPIKMAIDSFDEVRNSNLFKYSPYTALTAEQDKACAQIVNELIDAIIQGKDYNAIINGCAGTGKTVVLIKALAELVRLANSSAVGNGNSSLTSSQNASSTSTYDDNEEGSENKLAHSALNHKIAQLKAKCPNGLNVAYIVPLSGLQKPFKKVIKAICGSDKIVMTASQVASSPIQYDAIFIDEAHRLGTINKFTDKKSFNKLCISLLGKAYVKGVFEPTELDLITQKSKHCIFVYDQNQKVRSNKSINHQDFDNKVLNKHYTKQFLLTTQMRCKAGNNYVKFLEALFSNNIVPGTPLPPWKGYDFRVYDDVDQMVTEINAFNNPGNCGLSRVVAGYGWEWVTNKGKKSFEKKRSYIKTLPHSQWDIHIGDHDYFWNVENSNFIFQADRDEIGCVHTVQGFDLNYVGVIFGPEIAYDSVNGFKLNGKVYDAGVASKKKADVLQLVIRAYKVMLERGIRGCYVFACDPGLQKYLKQHVPSPAVAVRNLDMKVNSGISELTGLDISSNGTAITGNKVELNKADVDAVVSGKGGIQSIRTIMIDNHPYVVSDIQVSKDDEYYILSITEPQ